MDNLERAKLLIGLTAPSIRESAPSVSSTNTHTVTGTATSDSKDGYVMVDMGGDSLTYSDDQSVPVSTTTYIKKGDSVIVNLIGADGTGKTPIVIGVVARGDEQQQLIEKAILGVDVEYALSDSETSAPAEGWSTVAPEGISGKYVWQRTKVLDGSGSSSYSNPTCISGAKGDAGTGVSSIVEQYYLSSSNTTQTGGSWSTTCPTWVSGYYIWTRSVVTWTTGSTTYTTPVLANGINSANQTAAQASIKASSAQDMAQSVKNYFFSDTTGAHITATENDATKGPNTLITSDKVSIRDGEDELMSIDPNEINLGKNSSSAKINLCDKKIQFTSESANNNTVRRTYITGDASSNNNSIYLRLKDIANDNGTFDAYIGIESGADDAPNCVSLKGSTLHISDTTNNDIICNMSDLIKMITPHKVLFDNDAQAFNQEVTLSESAANYNYMEIFYHDTDGAYESKRIYSPNGMMMKLSTVQVGGDKDVLSVKSRWVQISGTSISTLYTPEEFAHNSSTTEGTNTDKIIDQNKILIDRVEGWN